MAKKKNEPSENKDVIGFPEFDELDEFIHAPARLKIISLLYVIKEADYVFIKNQTGLTWGNLSSHMDKLAEKQFIEVEKKFKKKKKTGKEVPQTNAKLTKLGREAFEKYREKLKVISSL